MAANEERKPRGQQECAERRMLTLSSSNIDLHMGEKTKPICV